MAVTRSGSATVPPVNQTLTRVVLLMRLLGWVWLLILAFASLGSADGIDPAVVWGTVVVGTAGTAVTYMAAKRGFLGELWYVIFDAAIALLITAAGWIAGSNEFLVGGYPVSSLFIVAYGTNFMVTTIAGIFASAVFAGLHGVMGLGLERTLGSVQFIIVALVVGWAFEALRQRERLRLDAEAERAEAESELAAAQQRSTRLEERSAIARQLHDSVLQTLKLISGSADDPDEVRYLSRVQERDLRRTINEYQSPYDDSFRARLLEARATVEDSYRVEIAQVINDDAEMNQALSAVVGAATEAMVNAARHSGSKKIDLFAEIRDGQLRVNVRDRGKGFDPRSRRSGISHSIVERVEAVGGSAEVKSAPGSGTEVVMTLPLQ